MICSLARRRRCSVLLLLLLLLFLLAALPLLGAHLPNVLLHLRLLLLSQNAEDLIVQLMRRSRNVLRAGGMRLRVAIEQVLNLIVLLVGEVHAVE